MKNSFKFLVIAILIVISNLSLALSEEWMQYTNGDVVTAIDEEGDYLWIGTTGGLVKMHKETGEKEFINNANSGLSINHISAISIGKNGIKWFGTWGGGISRFDGINWEYYISSNSGLTNNKINTLISDTAGNLWIGAKDAGLIRFDGFNWEIFHEIENVNDMAIDKMNNLWICYGEYYTNYKGIIKFDGAKWINMDSLLLDLPDDVIMSVAIDSNNNKWFGSYGKGVIIKYDDIVTTIINNSMYGFKNSIIKNISVEPDGNIWFVTGNGVLFYNDTSWTFYNRENSDLTNGNINKIIVADNKTWFATDSLLNSYDGINWKNHNTSNSKLPSNYVDVVAVDLNNNKWCGLAFGKGVVKIGKSDWEFFNYTNSGMKAYKINSIFIDKLNTKWFCTDSGLIVYNDDVWISYDKNNSSLPTNNINSITEDQNGDKWIATDSALVYMKGNEWIIFNKDNSGLQDNNIKTIAIDRNDVKWIGTKKYGLTRIHGDKFTLLENFNGYVNCISVDKYDNKWVGANSGISLFDNNFWYYFSSKDYNFLNESIKVLAVDSLNNKWFRNLTNVVKYNDTVFYNYTMINSGLTSTFVESIAIDKYNNIWFASYDGISQLISESISVEEKNNPVSSSIQLSASPNPFSSETKINYSIPNSGLVKIIITDILGNEVAVLKNEFCTEGQHSVIFNANEYSISNGVYFCTVSVGSTRETKILCISE